MNKTRRRQDAPDLRVRSNVSDWLAAIAEESPEEVQVLLLGYPGEHQVEAGYITLAQHNTSSSVYVSPDSFAASVEEARQSLGMSVIGMAHLHPGGMGAFASTVDERNLTSLAEILSKSLLRPISCAAPVVFTEDGECALDAYGRKLLKKAPSEPGKNAQTTSEPTTHREEVGSESVRTMEYVETRMSAWVYSITFSKGDTAGTNRQPRETPNPGVQFFSQAVAFTFCSDPECATGKATLIDDVPVIWVPGGEFAWTRDELRNQLRERVSSSSAWYGGFGYDDRGWGDGDWHAGHAHHGSASLPIGVVDGGGGASSVQPRRRSDFRFLSGYESRAQLEAETRQFGEEVARRMAELTGREWS